MCRYTSPGFIATKLESITPHGYGILLSEIDTGMRDWTEEIADKFYQSPLGGECRQDCEYNWPEDDMTRHAREEIVRAGRVPAQVRQVAESLITNGTVRGKRGDWIARNDRGAKAGTDVLFLVGATMEESSPSTLDAVAKLFERMGVSWTTIADEAASGAALFDLGYVAEAKESARRLASQISSRGATTIVTSCPHALYALRTSYAQWGVELPVNAEVLHTTEYLARHLEGLPVASKGNAIEGNLAYHDCAELGRRMEVFEPPREVLKRTIGRAPEEFYQSRELASSSGAGSSLLATHPDLAARIAQKTLADLRESGVRTVATACPNCRASFELANETYSMGYRIVDVLELAVAALR